MRWMTCLAVFAWPYTAAALRGCHNDVAALYGLLTQKYGWSRECIHALTDDGKRGAAGHPTRANITNGMRWLTQAGGLPFAASLASLGAVLEVPNTHTGYSTK